MFWISIPKLVALLVHLIKNVEATEVFYKLEKLLLICDFIREGPKVQSENSLIHRKAALEMFII